AGTNGSLSLHFSLLDKPAVPPKKPAVPPKKPAVPPAVLSASSFQGKQARSCTLALADCEISLAVLGTLRYGFRPVRHSRAPRARSVFFIAE
ncbi:MAG: hypothetical protein ACC645_14510, partial [Pirellulales bacterium]